MKRWSKSLVLAWGLNTLFICNGNSMITPPGMTADAQAPASQNIPNIFPIPTPSFQQPLFPTAQQQPTNIGSTESSPAALPTTPTIQTFETLPPLTMTENFGQLPAAPSAPIAIPLPNTIGISDEKIGIQGNWMKKKEWLIKAYEAHDEIQALAIEIQTSRRSFNDKFNVIDRELDTFYKTLGVDQGKLQETFANIMQYLEKKKARDIAELQSKKGTDTLSEREYQTIVEQLEIGIKTNKAELEQLKLDIKSIDDLDRSITDRLKRLDEQIERAMGLVKQAHSTVRDMWNIIDDNLAKNQYYQLKGSLLETLRSIKTYLVEDLPRDFDNVLNTMRNQMQAVTSGTKRLESAGLVIRDRTTRIDELKKKAQEEKARQLAIDKAKAEEAAAKRKLKKDAPQTWYQSLYNRFINFLSKIYRLFVSDSTTQPVRKKRTASAPLPAIQPISQPAAAPTLPVQPGLLQPAISTNFAPPLPAPSSTPQTMFPPLTPSPSL